MFDVLPVDILNEIFKYLTQTELLDILFTNELIYYSVMKYINNIILSKQSVPYNIGYLMPETIIKYLYNTNQVLYLIRLLLNKSILNIRSLIDLMCKTKSSKNTYKYMIKAITEEYGLSFNGIHRIIILNYPVNLIAIDSIINHISYTELQLGHNIIKNHRNRNYRDFYNYLLKHGIIDAS